MGAAVQHFLGKVDGVWRVQRFEEQRKPLSKQGELSIVTA